MVSKFEPCKPLIKIISTTRCSQCSDNKCRNWIKFWTSTKLDKENETVTGADTSGYLSAEFFKHGFSVVLLLLGEVDFQQFFEIFQNSTKWSKCSELCGGGTSTLSGCTDGFCEKTCNVEPCSVYESSAFVNSHMEDQTSWECNGGCSLEVTEGRL